MHFDWTIFRLLNNSVLLSSGCLKDHENLLIVGGFLVFLQNSRGWSHSELGYLERCDATPTWIREYFQDADGVDGQRCESISSQLGKEHPSSCTWQGMPGSEGGMPNLEHQRGTSHLTSHLLLESGLVPFLWHVGILVALRFFSTDHSDLFHTALKRS